MILLVKKDLSCSSDLHDFNREDGGWSETADSERRSMTKRKLEEAKHTLSVEDSDLPTGITG